MTPNNPEFYRSLENLPPGLITVGFVRRFLSNGRDEKVQLSPGEGIIFFRNGSPSCYIRSTDTREDVIRIMAARQINLATTEVVVLVDKVKKVLIFTIVEQHRADVLRTNGLISMYRNIGNSGIYAVVASDTIERIRNLVQESPNHLALFGDFFDDLRIRRG
jgi:hypothetical protein